MKEENNDNKIPKSPSGNTYKDFYKICRAYYDELMHISKSESPSLSIKDIQILNDVIKEIEEYSNRLLESQFIEQAKKLIDIGLVISDFFLKIFGEMFEISNAYKNENSKLSDKLKYPLSLKLILLKANFDILINYENDYNNGEKNLNEIIEIQLYLKSPSYYLASSKFHMAKIKYFFKDYEEAQKYALDAKNTFENYNNSNDEQNDNPEKKEEEDIIEKKITQNVSNILIFLAQVFLIKNEYKNAASCYENGYYLNLGRYGADNSITEYFKNKLDSINEEIKKFPDDPLPKTQVIINSNNPSKKSINNNFNNNYNNNNYNFKNYNSNVIHKGKAETYSFRIPTTSLYEPFLLTLYKIGDDDNDRYASELFLGNLCFDKQKLARYLGIKGTNFNSMFYSDDNLNIILEQIIYINGFISILDKALKTCLISSSCPMNKK